MGKTYLVFDTEANGLPITHHARFSDVSNWPRIIQLGWGRYSSEGEELSFQSSFIKPDGWTVPTEQFFIDNDLSTERCEREGAPLLEVFEAFNEDWAKSDVMVAHNLSFDKPVIGAEAYRYGIRFPKKLDELCTKLAFEPLCKIPGWRGKYKWPTLLEAHQWCFGEGFEGAHDAGSDVRACAKVLSHYLQYQEMSDIF